MWTVILYVLVGYAVVWLWLFFGSRDLCPRCGRNLVVESRHPLQSSFRSSSCSCGWREGGPDDPTNV